MSITPQSKSEPKFWATIEFLPGQRAAIVELHSTDGEWAGGGRVECRSGRRSDLYEIGYNTASMNARAKGGSLDRFSEYLPPTPPPAPPEDFRTFAANCGSRVEFSTPRRPANALNIEIATPAARCLNKRPSHWPESATALRWIGSGGSALVFGACSRNCPLRDAP